MFKLFWTGECRCADKSVMCQRLRIRRGVNCLGQTEVDYFYGRDGAARHCYHFVVVRAQEHQICRLQVAVDQSTLFRSGECRGDLLCNSDGGTRIERSAPVNAFVKILALD